MDERTFEVMKKYEKGDYVDPKDEFILDELASIGYAKYGYSFEEHRTTAALTDRGRRKFLREKIYRNPIKRFFYKYSTLLF